MKTSDIYLIQVERIGTIIKQLRFKRDILAINRKRADRLLKKACRMLEWCIKDYNDQMRMEAAEEKLEEAGYECTTKASRESRISYWRKPTQGGGYLMAEVAKDGRVNGMPGAGVYLSTVLIIN